jgi:hypothetical protein
MRRSLEKELLMSNLTADLAMTIAKHAITVHVERRVLREEEALGQRMPARETRRRLSQAERELAEAIARAE